MGNRRHLILLLFTLLNYCFCNAETNNLGTCSDPDCTAPISEGRATQTYIPNSDDGLPLTAGQHVLIYVRNYGEKMDKFGIEVHNKRGYVPKQMIREDRVNVQTLVPARRDFLSVQSDDSTSQVSGVASSTAADSTSQVSSMSPSSVAVASSGQAIQSDSLSPFPSFYTVPGDAMSSFAVNSDVPSESYVQTTATDANIKSGMFISSSVYNSMDSSFATSSPIVDKMVANSETTPSLFNSNNLLPTSEHSFTTVGPSESPSQTNDESTDVQFSTSIVEGAYNDRLRKTITKALDSVSSYLSSTSTGSTDVTNEDRDMQGTMSMLEQQGLNATDIIYGFHESNRAKVTADTDPGNIEPSKTTVSSSVPQQSTTTTAEIGREEKVQTSSGDNVLNGTPADHVENSTDSKTSESDAPVADGDSKTSEVSNVPHDKKSTVHNKEVEEDKEDEDEDENDDEDENHEPKIDNGNGEESKDEEIPIHSRDTSSAGVKQSELNLYSADLTSDADKTSHLENNSFGVSEKNSDDSEKNSDDSEKNSDDVSEKNRTKSVQPPDNGTNDQNDFDSQNASPPPGQRYLLEDSTSSAQHSTEETTKLDNFSDSGTTMNPIETKSEEAGGLTTNKEETLESPGFFSLVYIHETFTNFVAALRSVLDVIISWIPEPIYSFLDVPGISSRAVVFTAITAFPCALLLLMVVFLRERSKEQVLIEQLRETEYNLHLAVTERDILRDESKTLKEQLTTIDDDLIQEKTLAIEMKHQLDDMESLNKSVNSEQLANMDVIEDLQKKNEQHSKHIKELKSAMRQMKSDNETMLARLKDSSETITSLSEENDRIKEDYEALKEEKEYSETTMSDIEKQSQEKISKLEQSCVQLLQDTELWNLKVNELNNQLYDQASLKAELDKLLEEKNSEIQSLKTTLASLEALQQSDETENNNQTIQERIEKLMDVSVVKIELEKSEEVKESLIERLQQEKNKLLQLEVDMIELRSESEKNKLSYNQALQDKTEAQTKLDVLTKYFKDKELQLQKELGVQEAVRQRKEEDATHAERRVLLIEKENESYKYQVATLKQEIEETERNLKNQITAQEKKAHENWLAARAAERKAEDMKQDASHLRQRLTLLEREQENWLNSSQSDIVRPVPQRLSDGFGSHEGSISSEFVPRHLPPPLLDDLPMRPLSRPPMMPPPFGPPFDPMMPMPPLRPQPWRLMQDKHFDLERRTTPSDYEGSLSRRHHTPPYHDRRSSSPADENSKSRGSSPMHEPLPDFHNMPPPMPRHMEFPLGTMPRFPPPLGSSRSHKSLPPPPRMGSRPLPASNNSSRPNSEEYRRPHPDVDV